MDFEDHLTTETISSLYIRMEDQIFGKLVSQFWFTFPTPIYTETPINRDWIQAQKISRHINFATDPRNRMKRKAHYHRRRGQSRVRHCKPRLNMNFQTNSNNSTTVIEVYRSEMTDAPWNKSIQKESIKRHIINIHRYIHSNKNNKTSQMEHMKRTTSVHNTPVTHKGIIVEDISNHTISKLYVHELTSSNIHDSTTVNIHQSTTVNLHESTTANIHESTLKNIHESTPTNIHESTLTNIHESVTTDIHESMTVTGKVSTTYKEESSTEINGTSHEKVTDAIKTTQSIHIYNKTMHRLEATTKRIWSNLIFHKAQYYIKQTFYMPTLVVADKSFMDYHRDTDYDMYIMTAMNTAAECLHDLSLGVNVELSVVRIIYIEESNTFPPEGSMDCLLKKFCNWTHSKNRNDIKHPLHHDVAILITRREEKYSERQCDSLGSTYVGGACVAHKSCIIVQDTGLLMGVNIAHQLGHLLGAVNDDDEPNSCSSSGNTATTQFHHVMAPGLGYGTLVWSPRSKQSIISFFKNGYGVCLEDEPPKSLLQFSGILPGVMYNASYQCQLLSRGSKACFVNPIEPCNKLYCQSNGRHCTYSGEGPAQGTHCGIDKWCYNGACIQAGERPGSVEGGWGTWQSWEECSRTCGGGVQRSRRHCDSPIPAAGGRYCVGESDRYRTCNKHFCNPDEKSFRAVQCAEFDHIITAGEYHSWAPLPLQAADTCGLYCKSEIGVKMRLHPRMRNGTPCRKGTNDLCINGICTRVGCDWVIGSNVVKDRCEMCGGDGSHCHKVDGWFNQTTSVSSRDMELVVEIPKDSRKIIVYETANSCNMLAVSNSINGNQTEEFFFIGNKSNGRRGTFRIKSIHGIYLHVQPGTNLISIQGPLPVKIRVYVVMRGKLSPIYYSYMNVHLVENTEHATTETLERVQRNLFKYKHSTRYQWEFLEWSDCSARCEVGASVSIPHCVSVWFGRVSDSYCDITRKPMMQVRVCNERPCTHRWRTGPWGPCLNSIQWRVVHCVREARSYVSSPIITDDVHCDILKPDTIRNCQSDTPGDCRNDNHHRKINYHLNIRHSTDEKSTETSMNSDYNGDFLNFYVNNLSFISNNTSDFQKNTKQNIIPYQTTTLKLIPSVLYSPNYSLNNNYDTTQIESSENFKQILSKQTLLDGDFTPNENISKMFNLQNIITNSYTTNDIYGFFVPSNTTSGVPLMSFRPLAYTKFLNYISTTHTPYEFTTQINEIINKNKIRKRKQEHYKKKSKIYNLKKIFKSSKRKREIFKNITKSPLPSSKSVIDKSYHTEDQTFLLIKLAKNMIYKLNSIFNNTNKMYIVIDTINTENPVNVARACENASYNLNESSFDSDKISFTKNNMGTEQRNYKKISNFEDILKQSTNALMKPLLSHKSKRTYSNSFVSKIPQKVLTRPETLDELKKKPISNLKQVEGLEDVTPIYRNVQRNCFKNIVNDSEDQKIINIYCNNCYMNLTSPKNISVTKHNFINPTIKSKNTEKYYNNKFLKNRNKPKGGTDFLGNELDLDLLENEFSDDQEYFERLKTIREVPNRATPQFVDITLIPKHGRNSSFRTKIQKIRDNLNYKKKKKKYSETLSGIPIFRSEIELLHPRLKCC